MNRTDRLHAITEALRRADAAGRTANELAEDLEVSPRTIKRDISGLQQAGALIWSRPGPGGGYVLDTAASLPPVAFSAAQAVAVATALAVLPAGSPFSADARAAAEKLVDTLHPATAERVDALSSRVWVLAEPTTATPPAAVLRSIEQALTEVVALTIRYRAADGATSARTVEPVIVAWTHGHWYLVAHCRTRDAIRWFRFERIVRADLTRDHYEPHPVETIGAPPEHAAPVR